MKNDIGHKFYLKDNNSKMPTSIDYRIYVNGKIFKRSIGCTIFPELWDKDTQRPTIDKKLIEEYRSQIPTIIDQFKNIVTRIGNVCQITDGYFYSCRSSIIPFDMKELNERLNKAIFESDTSIPKKTKIIAKIEETKEVHFIYDYAVRFVNQMINGTKLIRTGKSAKNRYSDNTIKGYKTFLRNFKEFENSKKRRYKWSDLDQILYEELMQFSNEKDFKPNYSGKLIKILKVIAEDAANHKLLDKQIFRNAEFKTIRESVTNIYLNQHELFKIQNLDLSNKPKAWQKARDIFLIQCYTTLRIGDAIRIDMNNIHDTDHGKRIRINSQKTKSDIIVPVHAKVLDLLISNGGKSPKLAEQVVNRHIKEIGKLAGISEVIEQKETKGGESKTVKKYKYELITTHTGRRSAATNMYKSGIKPIDIMAMTGHSSEAVFLKYICHDKEEKANSAADNQFFK